MWDKNKIEDDKGDDEENYICLNEQRRILGADDPVWKACLSEDDGDSTKSQQFWSQMWSMPGGDKIAERMIVVLEKDEKEEDEEEMSNKKMTSRVTSFRTVSNFLMSAGSMRNMVSKSASTPTTTTTTPKKMPPPLPPAKQKGRTPPKITQRPRAKTPARPPGVAPSMRKSADLCDRKRLFEQFDLDGMYTVSMA